ncbi:hypothetical protein EAH89_24285 [Roseomonas nepalensis]|uniref:histidine kinase n=1 Tax=Muricoccus nepalensis TaxID=1854500 RepID=A0A502FC26_9PROT|nr:HWE histidine kinase domain-containing protein [Roseomonas nepalensis]TPG46922.1 hypothetical protein EAH89_24285 [Roseomonas nepalensis]
MPRDESRPAAEGAGPGAARRSVVGELLLLASVAFPMLVFLGVAAQDYRRTLQAAHAELLAAAETMAGHARNVFRFEALALGATEDWLRGVADSDILASPRQYHARLAALKRFAGDDLGITVIGADGRPLVDSDRATPPRGIDLSDRAYFRWHRDHPGGEPHVAAPLRSRVSGETLFFLSLRRNGPGGEFAGVIAAAVRQSSFIQFWDRAASDPLDAISLFRDDGLLLARRPAIDPEAGTRLDPDGPIGRAAASGVEGRVFGSTSPIDGVERMNVLRRIEGYPAFIVHGMPRSAVLAPWRDRLVAYGVLAGGATAALLSLSLLSRRRARALDLANATLEQRVEERTAEIQAGEARLRLLAREVDHRAKNALSVVQATLRLTPRRDAESFAASVEGRVLALARAQTLLAADQWRGASLGTLLRTELAPFVAREGEGPLAELRGPAVLVPPVATQPLAMVAHELATNAVKHGALSAPGGRVLVTWEVAGDVGAAPEGGAGRLRLRWEERGGPPVAGPPAQRGFGSRVLQSVVRGQLGGRLDLHWHAGGLVAELEVPLSAVARAGMAGAG